MASVSEGVGDDVERRPAKKVTDVQATQLTLQHVNVRGRATAACGAVRRCFHEQLQQLSP
jgi:hypothetical protein